MAATVHLFQVGDRVRWRWRGEGDMEERVGTIEGLLTLGDFGTRAYWITEDCWRCFVPVDEVIGLVRD